MWGVTNKINQRWARRGRTLCTAPPSCPDRKREEDNVSHERSATGYRTESSQQGTSQARLGFVGLVVNHSVKRSKGAY